MFSLNPTQFLDFCLTKACKNIISYEEIHKHIKHIKYILIYPDTSIYIWTYPGIIWNIQIYQDILRHIQEHVDIYWHIYIYHKITLDIHK